MDKLDCVIAAYEKRHAGFVHFMRFSGIPRKDILYFIPNNFLRNHGYHALRRIKAMRRLAMKRSQMPFFYAIQAEIERSISGTISNFINNMVDIKDVPYGAPVIAYEE